MITEMGERAGERDLRGALAAAVWVESIACGSVLGAAGALAIVTIAVLGGGFSPAVAVIAIVVAELGAGFGFAVGVLVGLVLALLVTVAHGRLRARTVATLMPLTAMVVSQPFTYGYFHYAGTGWAIAMGALDALLTLPGALWVATRYRRRAEGRRVH